MDRYLDLWDRTKDSLRLAFDDATFNETFESINNIYTFKNGYIYLVCPSEFVKNKLETFYTSRMNSILASFLATGETVKYKFITKKEIEEDIKKEQSYGITAPDPEIHRQYRVGNLKSSNSFKNFVVGKSNRLAYITALKVAQQPGMSANPLYIFGNVGLGKTHLSQAVGNFILDDDIRAKVLYIKTEEFIEDYGTASKNENFDDFRKKYDNIDLLIIDDVQFLSGKTKTQTEFFKLFEKLHEQNKQIIITSDRPANELKDIMERLTTRFAWGVTVDISTPDIEHRINILRHLATLEVADPNTIPDDVLEYIANSFPTDIRQLEGAFRRLLFYMTMEGYVKLSLETAKLALAPLLVNTIKSEEPKINKFEANTIVEEVAKYYMVSKKDIMGKNRQKHIMHARHITCYLLKELLNLTYQKIGALIGGRDHTTIMNSCERIQTDIDINEEVKIDVDNIVSKVEKK